LSVVAAVLSSTDSGIFGFPQESQRGTLRRLFDVVQRASLGEEREHADHREESRVSGAPASPAAA
jgi:hypothetical protein